MSRPAQGVDTARVTGLVFHLVHSVDHAKVTARLVSHPAHSLNNTRATTCVSPCSQCG